jgi:hypothetical protein
LLAVIGIAALAVLYAIFGSAVKNLSRGYGTVNGPSGYSLSAIGFAGLYDLLNQTEPGSSRIDPYDRTPPADNLLLATSEDSLIFCRLIYEDDSEHDQEPADKGVALLFLKKWRHEQHPDKFAWVANQTLLPTNWVEDSLSDALVKLSPDYEYDSIQTDEDFTDPDVEAETSPADEGVPMLKPRIVRTERPGDLEFSMTFSSPSPSIGEFAQLLSADPAENRVTPVVSAQDGLLVARIELERMIVYLVSDPDVADNMGLGSGQNAAFTINLIRHVIMRENLSGPITFLEFDILKRNRRSEFKLSNPLFTFPTFLIGILTLLSALLFWAALARRFGGVIASFPFDYRFGKSKLIDNSSRLMARPGLLPSVLKAYQKMTVQRVERAVHAPKLSDQDLIRWLDRAAAARGVKRGLHSILTKARAARESGAYDDMIKSAIELHKFSKELESGPDSPGRDGQ